MAKYGKLKNLYGNVQNCYRKVKNLTGKIMNLSGNMKEFIWKNMEKRRICIEM